MHEGVAGSDYHFGKLTLASVWVAGGKLPGAGGTEAEVGSAVQTRARRKRLKAGNYEGEGKERFRDRIRIRESQKVQWKRILWFSISCSEMRGRIGPQPSRLL